jgi:hypothetical protein
VNRLRDLSGNLERIEMARSSGICAVLTMLFVVAAAAMNVNKK